MKDPTHLLMFKLFTNKKLKKKERMGRSNVFPRWETWFPKRRRVELLGGKWSPKRCRVGLLGGKWSQNGVVLAFWGETFYQKQRRVGFLGGNFLPKRRCLGLA